jgi:EAL domain-containing protein (putative c-di-GMP-specific phosphodiesterase class I)
MHAHGDRSTNFRRGLTSDPDDAVIVQSATDLGHNLGLSVVAEGVEDETTLAALKALGIDVAQGFHLGRPMPEERLHRWIADQTGAQVPAEATAQAQPGVSEPR